MSNMPFSHSHDPALAELVQFSSEALRRKTLGRSPIHADALDLTAQTWLETVLRDSAHGPIGYIDRHPHLAQEFAPPLMPLRDRDLAALSALFTTDVIHEIEADIAQNLLKRFPEPHWDDFSASFLPEYL